MDDELEFTLNYDVQNSIFLSVDLNANSNKVDFVSHFNHTEYPYYNSYSIIRGWSEANNIYSFNTKVCTYLYVMCIKVLGIIFISKGKY